MAVLSFIYVFSLGIELAKEKGARYRLGPELEVT